MASAPSTAPRSSESANPNSAGASSQPAVDVIAVTTRDDFLLELGQTLDSQAAVHPVDTLDAALEVLASGKRAQILALDTRAVANVRAAVDAAVTRAPRALVLVFAEESTEKQVGAVLKGSKVFAVLPTPVDARKTQAVFAGAIAEALTAKAAAPARSPTPADLSIGAFRPGAAAPARDAGAQGPEGRPRKLLLLAAAVAAVAAAGGGYWYFTRGTSGSTPSTAAATPAASAPAAAPQASAPAEAAAPEPVADTSLVQGKVDELLEKARAAMHERRYTEPAGDNALLYYRSAAAADASNGEARDGLQRVAGVLAGRFDEAMSGARFDEAAQTLANFKAAAPTDARVAPMEQKLYSATIAKALADGNLERAVALVRQAQAGGGVSPEQLARWRADIGRRVEDAKVTRLAGLVQDRIREGRLSESDDSAKSYLQQLLAAAPANAATQRAQHDLGTAYLRKAREAALAKNPAEQDRWLNEARGVGMKAADILAFQRDLANARQKAAQAESERAVQMARERIRDGRLTDPAQDSAVFYLTQLQTSDPANAALADAGRELAGKLLERARASLAAGRSADADIAQAKRWGADAKDLAAVQQAQSAPKGAAQLDAATLAAGLKRLRAPPPDYPESALAHKISGSVTVQFTVDVNGETRDIHVIEATPPGVFDRAALSAIKHWRYAPMVVNGTAVAVPVKALVRFELPK